MSQCAETTWTVSVAIPAYNAAEFIGRAVESVLAQSRPPEEVIVVDDGSTDGTADIVRRFGDKVKYIRQRNMGVSAARNAAIRAAGSEWIAFLDADDEWERDYLSEQMKLLRRNPRLAWTTGNFVNCLCWENRRGPQNTGAAIQRVLGGREACENFFEAFRSGLIGWTGTMVVRRAALIEAGLFREGEQRYEDTDMWFRVAYRHTKIGYLEQPLAIHHVDVPGSLTRTREHIHLLYDMIDRHMTLSREYGCREEFRKCAGYMLHRTMRSMLFSARRDNIRDMLRRFKPLIALRYRLIMGILTIFPRFTAAACHFISRVTRAIGLRKKFLRRPLKAGPEPDRE